MEENEKIERFYGTARLEDYTRFVDEVTSDQSKNLKDMIVALEILEEVEENINTCCAITMEPDDVLVLIDKLKNFINEC